jgi:AcrR family transcriptional regulator
MPTHRVPTRRRLIDTARAHFYRDGFRGAGLDAILADVGISKAGFYKHFASKEDLMVGVLEAIDEMLGREFRQMVRDRGGPSAVGQLRALVDVVHEEIMQESFHGCIFVGAAMEFPLAHEPAHRVALRHKQSIEQFVYELAERAGCGDPQALAQELCLIIEGAYVTRSVTNDASTIAIARRVVNQVLDRHLAPARAPVPASGTDVPLPRAGR